MKKTHTVKQLLPSNSVIYVLFILLLLLKVLWNYWERDLTSGDTSSYFQIAYTWAMSHEVNIVWSPLYTAYYGVWLAMLQDAVSATFMHRLFLILITSILVAWIGMKTLPTVFAIILVAWWIVLPIHYDTLYEVHLFGALPLLLLAVVGIITTDRWLFPCWIGITLVTAVLIRNEYIVLLSVLVLFLFYRIITGKERQAQLSIASGVLRYSFAVALSILLIVFTYHASYLKGDDTTKPLERKHTVNMCQVYAFGYQQRNSDWKLSPWTECRQLMQREFGQPLPSLRQMIAANPIAVAEHMLWNLYLLPAGMELLLFNAVGSDLNPDYPPPKVLPYVPHILLFVLLIWCLYITYRCSRTHSVPWYGSRNYLRIMLPLLIGAVLMVIAVVLTQRPRPSYLLGFGVLLVWTILLTTVYAFPILRKMNGTLVTISAAVSFLIVSPSYSSLDLPSKKGISGQIYAEAVPYKSKLCAASEALAISRHASRISTYICPSAHSFPTSRIQTAKILDDFKGIDRSQPDRFVAALSVRNVTSVILDPFFIRRNKKLGGCSQLRNAFFAAGWELLSYKDRGNHECISIFSRTSL